jgi:hypothetical protein
VAIWFLLQILRQGDCQPDVLRLGGLVAASQEDNQDFAALGVMDALPRSNIDLQLANAARQNAMLTRIAVH